MSDLAEPSVADTSSATAQCAREPIHIPGAIQPHGALLAAAADGLVVTHASANLAAFLACSAESALGRPLREVAGEAVFRWLSDNEGLNAAASSDERTMPGPNGHMLHLRAYRSGRFVCLDIQPDRPRAGEQSPFALLQSTIETFRHAGGSEALCKYAVRGLREITGYDRVMAYRFDADGHGEVIAEAIAVDLEPYLGLNYPASDVPPQARQLYLRQRVGAIADASYEPVPLLVDPALQDAAPVDLTHSALRSVSPFHRAYMRNMQTAASLTISLTSGPELWGMLVCHNATVRVADPALRSVADIIGQVVSLLIGTLVEAETNALQIAHDGMLLAVNEQLATPMSLSDALVAAQADLLGLVGASGAILRVSGVPVCVGRTPPEAERLLDILLAHGGGQLLAINDLGLRHPEFDDCISHGSGALLMPLSRCGDESGVKHQGILDSACDDAILWFRPERIETVTWGGNPTEHLIADSVTGRLSPRASFVAWKQIVSGRSVPWTKADHGMARRLRGAIEVAVAQRTRAALARLRHYDPLTGLPNRSLLQERLTEIGRGAWPRAALLFLDLDRFKAVNDTMGHVAGDALLIEVAQRLTAAAGPYHLVARLGGDEFVVFCEGLEPDAIALLTERIRTAIEAPFEIAGRPCHISVSIGIAFADHLANVDLIRAADMAMYAAKQSGGNRGVVFEAVQFDRAARQFELEIDLRQALASGDQFVLLYQPVFGIVSGTTTLVGFEALVRWRHPRSGWMSPALFIPLAEKSGLILPLGDWVLATAVRQARAFRTGHQGLELSMAVNISALQLPQPGFCAHLAKLLEDEGLPPTSLCLEVTESILADEAASCVLDDIRSLGTTVAIDDFGQGYSSLSYLRRLPADTVKLDRTFLESIQGESPGTEFISAVTTLAHAAGKSVVFEGIETQDQFDIALAAGADMVQGFLFAPALSATAAKELVDRHLQTAHPGPNGLRRNPKNLLRLTG
jgi:diguanylate cyclase (GGDEF)-like protein